MVVCAFNHSDVYKTKNLIGWATFECMHTKCQLSFSRENSKTLGDFRQSFSDLEIREIKVGLCFHQTL